ncbi:hypothetical protein N864_09690 [Intrasporangium chromatireducens Q5-1]|uniref:Uncharacterized protein n=1 Tax=Intrasporangium chromatireducens Q5-1 TaxID=584657 RepID=W9GLR3_9MICO|nr:hypothetical protein N864_09690 [Intrasporangium chromatireducens Q5-1]
MAPTAASDAPGGTADARAATVTPWASTRGTATWSGMPSAVSGRRTQGAVAHSRRCARASDRSGGSACSSTSAQTSSDARAASKRPPAVSSAGRTACGSRKSPLSGPSTRSIMTTEDRTSTCTAIVASTSCRSWAR